MSLWKQNVVKVDLGSYLHYWRGVPKVGKTTLFYDLIKELYNGDFTNGLLISIGQEMGHKTLNGLIVAETPTWSDFEAVVDELVNNKSGNNFKFVALDTIDELFNLGTQEVLRLHYQKYKKPADSLNAAFGGWGAGKEKLLSIVGHQITRLRYAGYGIVVIGHTKVRNVKEKITGEEYQQLTTSLPFDLDSLISNQADIIATMVIDKDIDGGKLQGTQRYIVFRDDGYTVDCGSRFANIPDRVIMNAQNYIDAVTQAIKSASGKTEDEIQRIKQKEIQEREEKYQLQLVISEIDKLAKEKANDNREGVIKAITEYHGNANYNNIKDINIAKQVLEALKNL